MLVSRNLLISGGSGVPRRNQIRSRVPTHLLHLLVSSQRPLSFLKTYCQSDESYDEDYKDKFDGCSSVEL